jgi:predicted MFS family arabinose efflux permease
MNRALWAGIHGMVVATSVGQVLPVLMTTLSSELHLSVTQAGLLAAADLGAATVASVVCARPSAKFALSTVALVGTVIVLVANLACLLATGFGGLLALRLIAGVGAGVLTVACVTALSQNASPARAFAMAAFAQTAFGAALNVAIPSLNERYGWSACFVVIAAVAAPGLRIARYYVRSQTPHAVASRATLSVAGCMALVAVSVAFCAIGATWANLGGLGERSLLTVATIGIAVSAASIAGPVATALTALVGNRIPSLLGLSFGSVAMLAGVTMLELAGATPLFYAGAIAFMFGWAVYVPYAMGLTSAIDPTGALSVIATACANGGFSLGPLIAVPAIAAWGVGAVPYLTFALLLCALGLIGPLTRKSA